MKNKNLRSQYQLPIVNLHGVDYFVDTPLNKFREVDNPYNVIDFDSENGQQMCAECVVRECPDCGFDELFHEDETGKMVCSMCGNPVSLRQE